MADDDQPFDIYTDAFTVTITPFGANVTLSVREAHPSIGRQQQTTNLGTLRTRVEHLKVMVALIRKQILAAERETGVKFPVPLSILNQLQLPLEDWENFWRQPEDI